MKIFKILRNKDVGSIGIGAMIVFIAMVLVAGIAASVLVQTANKLEMKAMTTGQETTAEVATGLRVVDIEGQKTLRWMLYNRSTEAPFAIDGYFGDDDETWLGHFNYTRLHNMSITLSPRAGSRDIDLSQTVIEISNSTVKCILGYSSGDFQGSVGTEGVFGTAAYDLRPDQFGVIELEDADNSCSSSNPVINRGDKIMLTVNLSACFFGLEERCDVWGMVIPEDGSPGIFGFRTPASYTDTVYDLY
jgi:flagellin FlaB